MSSAWGGTARTTCRTSSSVTETGWVASVRGLWQLGALKLQHAISLTSSGRRRDASRSWVAAGEVGAATWLPGSTLTGSSRRTAALRLLHWHQSVQETPQRTQKAAGLIGCTEHVAASTAAAVRQHKVACSCCCNSMPPNACVVLLRGRVTQHTAAIGPSASAMQRGLTELRRLKPACQPGGTANGSGQCCVAVPSPTLRLRVSLA